MKVLQINKYFYQKGGAETVFFNTIDLLEEYGHEVIPFSLKNEKNKPSDFEHYFVDYPELSESNLLTKVKNIPSFLYNRSAAKQLEKLILTEKPDVAHIHLMFNSLSVAILPVLKKYKIPVVMTLHDYRLVCPAYTITDGKGRVCERCFNSRSYWHCITNKCAKGNFVNSVLLSVDAYLRKYVYDPLNYVDNFVFVSFFSQRKYVLGDSRFQRKAVQLYNFTSIKKSTEISKKNEYILYVGRLSHEKGLKTLIDAVNDFPEVNLKVIGTGPLNKDLGNQIKGENIELLGFKCGRELTDYMEKAKYLIIPSEWYENNPMVVIEAMTLGTPVIGSNIGGIPELIKDGESGFLFEPKDVKDLQKVIFKALDVSESDYQKMCNLAEKEAATKFSKEVHYNKLIQIYTALLAEK